MTLAAKFWSKILNENNKKNENTGEKMAEEKPKKETKTKTVKDILNRNK